MSLQLLIFLFIAVLAVGVVVFLKFYLKTSKEIAFVRTGLGGEKVFMGGGAIVIPLIQNITKVNLNTLRLPIFCTAEKSLITKDKIRIDVEIDFYVHVAPNPQSISNAAATLGSRTLAPESLKSVVEGKFINSIGAVVAETTIQELHENRKMFAAKIREFLEEDLGKNGLELESVSITSLDQADIKFFNSSNIFDAEGLTRLTETIEQRKKKRNDIEQDTQIQIKNKNLEAEKTNLLIEKEINFARLNQEKEIAFSKSEQQAEVAKKRFAEEQSIDIAAVNKKYSIDQINLETERKLEEVKIIKEKLLREAELNKAKDIDLLQQVNEEAVFKGSISKMAAKSEAEEVRAVLVTKEERVIRAQELEVAERNKDIAIIRAKKEAEEKAVQEEIFAKYDKKNADEKAAAEKIRIAIDELRYKVEAEGQRIMNESRNILSENHLQAELRKYLIDHLAEIIKESSEPLKNIESIKVIQTSGLMNEKGEGRESNNIFDGALRYRAQSAIIEKILDELGLSSDGNLKEKK